MYRYENKKIKIANISSIKKHAFGIIEPVICEAFGIDMKVRDEYFDISNSVIDGKLAFIVTMNNKIHQKRNSQIVLLDSIINTIYNKTQYLVDNLIDNVIISSMNISMHNTRIGLFNGKIENTDISYPVHPNILKFSDRPIWCDSFRFSLELANDVIIQN